jgi:photosystem II stability/assembly factor-like uncharacterized protein
VSRCLVATAFVVLAVSLPLAGQEAQDKPITAPKEFANLKYRSIGPSQGGRLTRVSGVTGDPRTYYAATASGGVWKSADGGVTWTPIFDTQPVSSIGSLAVAPSDPNVLYVGSGEANIRGNVAAGNGIYKSVDAGKTWTHVWHQEGQIGTMAVHPRNPDIAYAAVLGHAFGPNPERGVYRTRDGGRTWQQVLKKDSDTGASDVALDPSNPNIVFAGLWQARRTPWSLTSGGPGSGLFVSRDGGDTWKALSGGGLPAGPWGKVGIGVAPSDGRRVYALIEAEKGGLFRSDDGGDTWTLASANRGLRQRAWYYSTLTVHPRNPNEVWFPQVPLLKTVDGGRTIEYVKNDIHGDHHDLWFDPAEPRRMIVGNDGGPAVSTDGGEAWHAAMLPIGQFYHVSADSRVPFRVAGAQQDLGTAQGPSNSLGSGGIAPGDWYTVGGGEAGHVVSDWSDPDVVYAGEYLGILTRYDHRTRQAAVVGAWPDNPSGWGAADMKYRFQWTAPIAISPHDARTVYHGAQVVFRTRDGGQSWEAISPDLTRNDPSRQQWSGGPITGDNTGVETYCTVFAIAESPKEAGLIWAGSDDGLVHVTRDAGASWVNVTSGLKGAPEFGTVSMIEPSPHDAGTAYVVVDAHRLDDMRPYLYRTTDYGKTWARLDGPLPRDVYLHAVREDPARRGMLYLGTERGVMFSRDAGATWLPLRLNLPTVAVHDLVVKDESLVVGTHGRSIWILDDLRPVRLTTPEVTSAAVHVFPVADAIAWRYADTPKLKGNAANPPRGASFYYALATKPEGEVTLEITDASGRLVRRLSSVLPPPDGVDDDPKPDPEKKPDLPTEAGVNRAVWDLRWHGARKIRAGKIDLGDPDPGPFVAPGTYAAKLSAAGTTATTAITVLADPRLNVPAADLVAQQDFALAVLGDVSRITDIVTGLRAVREQLVARRALLAGDAGAQALMASTTALVERVDALEAKLHNPSAEVTYDILAMKGGARLYSRLIPVFEYATAGVGAPTQGQRQVHAMLAGELRQLEAEYTRLAQEEVPRINDAAAKLGLGFVTVPKR